MICEAQFVGGPADGRLQAFPGEEPPLEVALEFMSPIDWNNPDAQVCVGRHLYRRQVSPSDDGPLWQLVYETTRPPATSPRTLT